MSCGLRAAGKNLKICRGLRISKRVPRRGKLDEQGGVCRDGRSRLYMETVKVTVPKFLVTGVFDLDPLGFTG